MSGVPIVAVKIEHYCFNHSERAPGIYTCRLDTFKALDHMEQYCIVCELYNTLASQCIQYGTDEMVSLIQRLEESSDDAASFMHINTAENSGTNVDYYLMTNNSEVLDILHEKRSYGTTDKESIMLDVLDCPENVFLVEIPKDKLVLYTDADIGKKIPHLEEQTKMQVWRSDPSVQTYQDDSRDPDLVLIGLTALRDGFSEKIIGYAIPNDIYCDANKAISQQIINYCNSQTDHYLEVSCPDSDGRDAVYLFNGVPFHSTSSRNYCTMLCAFLGILGERDLYNYRLGPVPDHTHLAELTPDTHQSRLPIMTHFQKKGHYEHVLMTTLGEYIKASLEFQLSKGESDPDRFAYPGKAEKPTEEKIRSALTAISELLQSNVRS
ncbi:hypothetical protein [Endozoicomonas sp.]|uniref:hypothetical protein n=1 Tax=Endozoicomonas sp. TaxID=1892382 RepID=UPI003AF4A531